MTEWIPEACTLPTAERPFRVAEFDALFRTARAVDRPDAVTLSVTLDRSALDTARDLAARETECCSFFDFTFTSTGDTATMRVTVPPAHTGILDALASATEPRR